MKNARLKKCISVLLLFALLAGFIPGMGGFPARVHAVSPLGISDVKIYQINENDFDSITFQSPVAGLGAANIVLTNNTSPSLHPMLVKDDGVSYDSATQTYTLKLNDINALDTYTLTVTKEGYGTYTKTDLFYGELAAATDIDIDPAHERNIFDTFTRSYNASTGVLTVDNAVYAADAKLYPNSDPSSLYYKIDTNNGYPINGAYDYRVIGAFLKAPPGAVAAKRINGTTKKMVVVDNSELINNNGNYMTTVQDGGGSIYAYPAYRQIAGKSGDLWSLYDPADRIYVVEWYGNASYNAPPMRVLRFKMEVTYRGDGAAVEAPAGMPALSGGNAVDQVTLAAAVSGGVTPSAQISGFSGSWNGGSLTVGRVGGLTGASGAVTYVADLCQHDRFGVSNGTGYTVQGTSLVSTGNGTFAAVDSTSVPGKLTVSFNTNATDTLVQDVLRHITYSNATPYGDAIVRYTLRDSSAANTVYADTKVTSSTIYVDRTTYDTGKDAADGFNLAEALAVAKDGDTIKLADGTYVGQFLVTRAVTMDAVNGSSGNVTLQAPAAASLTKSEQDFLTQNGRWRMPVLELRTAMPGSGTVTVKNIKVDGAKNAVQDGNAANKDLIGIAVFNTNAVIDNVTITDIAATAAGERGLDEHFAIVAEGSSILGSPVQVTVQNCSISSFQKAGIIAWGPKLHADILNNTITGTIENGLCLQTLMQIGSAGIRTGTAALVRGNTFSSLGSGASSPYSIACVLIRQAGAVEIDGNNMTGGQSTVLTQGVDLMEQQQSVNIHDNTFINLGVGVATEANNPAYYGAHTISGNDFAGTELAVCDTSDVGVSEENVATITVNSSATVTNSKGYAEYLLSGGNDSFTDTGAAPTKVDGGAGDDSIATGSGQDILIGGAGNDTLTGGGGGDIFQYAASGNGTDTITDFGTGDKIRVAGCNFSSGTVTVSDGAPVAAHSVEIEAGNGATKLYIDTDASSGAAELEITLTGVYSPENFVLDGEYIQYVPTASLAHNVAGNAKIFGALTEGYASAAREALAVTVTSTRTNGNVAVTLGGNDAAGFILTGGAIGTLSDGSTGTFTVESNTGLAAGTYNATVTITSDQFPAGVSFTVRQIVSAPGSFVLTATPGSSHVNLSWAQVTGTVYYDVYKDSAFTATVAGSVYAYDAVSLINGTTYSFQIKAADDNHGVIALSNTATATPLGVPGAPTGVTAAAGNRQAVVGFTAPSDNGGSPITAYTVYVYWDGARQDSLTVTGVTSNPVTVPNLVNGITYTFTVMAVNAQGNGIESAATGPVTPRSGGGGSSSGTSSAAPASTGVDVLVNGKVENAGTATTTTQGGKTVTTISVDEQKLEQRLAAEGNNAVITIPINTGSDVVIGELNGQMIKNMENQQAVIEVKTGTASYTLPAQQFNINDISTQLGVQVALQDIKVQIEIARPSDEAVRVVESAAGAGEFTIIAPPVEFSVRCTYGDRTVEIKNFNAYVERTIAIPDGVDPNKITTGIVVEPDGTVRHVPTRITVIDGKYYAVISSLTNSTYSVVWHPLEFRDAAAHWAKEAINNMGSRMVVTGVGDELFEPDRDITRGEFAAIVVRGLGLRPGTGKNPFTDVSDTAWYCGFIETAYAYGMISGYGNGTFGPDDKITREQAMAMTARAMKITGLKAELAAGEADNLLAGFEDSEQSAAWARESIAACVKTGIVSGKSRETLAPGDEITRAEVAVIIMRLLQKSNLI